MPQQLPTFLIPFAGSLVTVPANGQCAYAALCASTAHVEGHRLQFTSDVVRGINVIKRSIYTLMMSNLAQDVECGVVDPSRELERLYPSQPPPKDPASATAALYNHYGQERSRSANTQIPSEFWAGAEVLRAMAQYLREPLLVLDVTANNDAHLQRYYYQEYRLKSGDVHESGCGGSMADVDAKLMLQQYARLHVLPVLIVLKNMRGITMESSMEDWQCDGTRRVIRNLQKPTVTLTPGYQRFLLTLRQACLSWQAWIRYTTSRRLIM
ncbi:hypothetical protein PR003_g14013 [Phytophthora rubi]|uniref:OTU domain-containing protein n=1 Tax=Phytophthora rubi TaxID=129364 RepID=A0A6A4F580_9STRA|nr:hypothetical protein PR003_g14013 [Phytophthora rubi]